MLRSLRTLLFFLLVSCLLFTLAFSAAANDSAALIGPDLYPEGVNPLTGLAVADPALLNRRPILVKISDYPPFVRPQYGLNAADLVWEHLLSGGVTRFSAVYLANQELEQVGPIRSARLVDFELTRIYRSLFVYSGMAQGTIDVLNTDAVVTSRAVGGLECPALCRIPREGVALEHTEFGNLPEIRRLAQRRGRDTTPERLYGMAFSPDVPPGGTAANGVQVAYAETLVQWDYDLIGGGWRRSQDGEPHLDALTESQVMAANVIIIEDAHHIQPVVAPDYWGPGDFAFSVNFIGSGRMILFRDGRFYEGEWRRATREEPLTYYDRAGSILPFKPGNTFFNLVPGWIDGYQLTLLLDDPATVSVGGTVGVSMRVGPGDAYVTPDVAYPGDTFMALGRNRAADWVQLLRVGEAPIWLPVAALELDGLDVFSLPVVRPTVER